MSASANYELLIARNSGYVDDRTQERIRGSTLLIAGCGIGSSPAVCGARLGFENFILVDGDTVDTHNLNRQFYDFADIGMPKVDALKDKILRINPGAKVDAVCEYLGPDNTDSLVSRSNIVFDTIDFLDLGAILELHTSARRNNVHIFTALSVGFGALVWSFPPTASISLVDILAPDVSSLAANGGEAPSYADVFALFVQRIAPHLDKEVVVQIGRVLTLMKEGKPCPAPQVAVGSFAIGAMATSMIHDLLSGNLPTDEPQLIIHSFKSHRSTHLTMSDLMS
jgi:hypothetical protein